MVLAPAVACETTEEAASVASETMLLAPAVAWDAAEEARPVAAATAEDAALVASETAAEAREVAELTTELTYWDMHASLEPQVYWGAGFGVASVREKRRGRRVVAVMRVEVRILMMVFCSCFCFSFEVLEEYDAWVVVFVLEGLGMLRVEGRQGGCGFVC